MGGPNFRAFFPLSRLKIRSFLPSLGVFSWNFGGVFEGGNLKCGLSCEAPAEGKNKFRAPTPSGPPPLRAPTPSGPHPFGPNKKKWPNAVWKNWVNKIGRQMRLAKCGQSTWAKCDSVWPNAAATTAPGPRTAPGPKSPDRPWSHEFCGGRGKKKRTKFWAVHGKGGPGEGRSWGRAVLEGRSWKSDPPGEGRSSW